jgi:putative ATP-dependent endonuclease of OLD family
LPPGLASGKAIGRIPVRQTRASADGGARPGLASRHTAPPGRIAVLYLTAKSFTIAPNRAFKVEPMFLQGLRIENFRAIRKTVISFDDGTALIGENDCGISSVLDALELALGFDDKDRSFPPHLFHREHGSDRPNGPIRLQLRFSERRKGDWNGEEFAPFEFLLPERGNRLQQIWYEISIRPGDKPQFRLRSPGSGEKSSDPKLIGRFRRMNPVIRVSAGALTGHGEPLSAAAGRLNGTLKVSPEVLGLMKRINQAVGSRLSGKSTDLKADLEDGYQAAFKLMEMGEFKLGKWESGLTRSVNEIIGWSPDGVRPGNSLPMQGPGSAPERLGILLLIGALIRARPGGMAPDADPLWIIEEPEAHLHPITLTSVAIFVSLIQRQKIVTTYSGDLLAAVPLGQVRRLVRHDGELIERRVRDNVLSRPELRRFHYHIRTRFGIASFARFWLLVEGESEFWILPQVARLMAYDFALEGIACVEFAQCGLDPLIKVAEELGIGWHVLVDGDNAGKSYAETVHRYLDGDVAQDRLTVIREKDIERCFWSEGYDDVYKRHARLPERKLAQFSPGKIIQTAVRKRSKPFLALSVVEAIAAEDSPGIPRVLEDMIGTCVDLARSSPSRLA